MLRESDFSWENKSKECRERCDERVYVYKKEYLRENIRWKIQTEMEFERLPPKKT